jgi:hypothetical protein
VPPTLVEHTAPQVRVSKHPRRRRLSGFRVAALGLVAVVGIAAAALLGAGRGDAPTRTVTRTNLRTVVSTTTYGATAGTAGGATLDRQGYARMQAGDYTAALPLLERSVAALQGTDTLDEAYADYNLAFTRFALGSCDGVLALLDRSESIQGRRAEIDRLRQEARRTCSAAGTPGEPGNPGKGHGKGKGHSEGDEG